MARGKGRKKGNTKSRSNRTPPVAISGGGGEHEVTASSLAAELTDQNLNSDSNELDSSYDYSTVMLECVKAQTEIKQGNYDEALKLLKNMCARNYNFDEFSAFMYRIEADVYMHLARISDGSYEEQRECWRYAIKSAEKVASLAPDSIEYKDVIQECEGALAIEKDNFQDESQQKISTTDARIVNVLNELRQLIRESNICVISRWVMNLGKEEKFKLIPLRSIPEDQMEVRLVQASCPKEIKKADMKSEEWRKTVETQEIAERPLQQKPESIQTQSGGDKGQRKLEPTQPQTGGVKGQGVGDRRKSGLTRKNESSTERNDDRVRGYWKTMRLDMKRDLVQINISDLKAHIKLLKDGSDCKVLEEALEFVKSNSCWTYWMCCQCDKIFPDSDSHMQHVIQEHIGNLQELFDSCGLGRYEENDNFKDESSSSGIVETPEKINFNEDQSCLLLDESSLPSKLPPSISNDTLNGKVSATTADIGRKDGANLDDNAFLSWILSGPGEMCPREEKVYQAIEIFQMLEKEFNQLHILSQQKSEHLCYKEALQRVENLCPEEGKKEEHMPEFDCRSYESVLRKQRVELIKNENACTHIKHRFELDAISIVLKEAKSVDVDQCGVKETYDGEKDERKAKNYLHQPEFCIKSVIKKQKEKLNTEIDDIDKRIWQHAIVWEQWKAKLNPASFDDYRFKVVPWLKSFLRANLEDLANKDAAEKADAASKELLQEESEKVAGGGVTNSGHQNQKPNNNKKKKKGFKKNKDSKQVAGSNKSNTISSGAAEKFSFPSVEADAAEKDDTCNQQEEEVWGRVELGAGEGMLKEELEFHDKLEGYDPREEGSYDLQHGFTLPRGKKSGKTNLGGSKPWDIADRGRSKDTFPPLPQMNGRKVKKNEKSSKDNGNKHQPISSKKENAEAGQATSSGSFKGKLNQRDASLSASTLEMPEKVFQEEEVLENVDGGDEYGTGLINEFGENNCFLNVIVQSLRHLRRFQDEFLNSYTVHDHQGKHCVICALHDIFVAMRNAEIGKPVDPSSLRTALSELNSKRKLLSEDIMNDAAEVLGAILKLLHESFSSNFSSSDTDTEEDNKLGSWDCEDIDCIAHSLFGMDIYWHMYCYDCSLESRHNKHTSFFHTVTAANLRIMKAKHPECSFDQLLCLIEMDGEVSCLLDDGGCEKKGKIQKYLSTSPYVFTIVLAWQTSCEDPKDIKATLDALAKEIDISIFYRGLDSQNIHCLDLVVCYYGRHFICFVNNHESEEQWLLFNDQKVEKIGSWENVLTMCENRRAQPHLLLYKATN